MNRHSRVSHPNDQEFPRLGLGADVLRGCTYLAPPCVILTRLPVLSGLLTHRPVGLYRWLGQQDNPHTR